MNCERHQAFLIGRMTQSARRFRPSSSPHRPSTLDYGCSSGHSTYTHGQTTSSCSPHCPGSYSADPGTNWCNPWRTPSHRRGTPLSRRTPTPSPDLGPRVVRPSRNRRHIHPARSSYPVRPGSLKYTRATVGLIDPFHNFMHACA